MHPQESNTSSFVSSNTKSLVPAKTETESEAQTRASDGVVSSVSSSQVAAKGFWASLTEGAIASKPLPPGSSPQPGSDLSREEIAKERRTEEEEEEEEEDGVREEERKRGEGSSPGSPIGTIQIGINESN